MQTITIALIVLAAVIGCARQASAPSTSPAAERPEPERNLAGYGLHLGLGGFVADSGVWSLPQRSP
jgi:hypothetical protein